MPLVAVKVKYGSAYTIYALEEDGKCELLDFLQSIDEDEMAKIVRYLDRWKDHGIKDTEILKPVRDGIFELRTWGGTRVFCFYDAGKVVICSNGYVKKKNKLDPQQIKRAEVWRDKYLNAKSSNTLEYRDGTI